jgi:phosphatidate cytidylyltransferase
MTYDPGKYDDDRQADGGRHGGTPRPAWDAATYGTPEDLRRPRDHRGALGRTAALAGDTFSAADSLASYPTTFQPSPPPSHSVGRDVGSHDGGSYDGYESSSHESSAYEGSSSYGGAYDGASYPSFAPASSAPPGPASYAGEGSYAVAEPTPYPGGRAENEEPDPAPEPGPGRAGRNLPAAIGVGLGLGALVVLSLFLYRPAFLAVVAGAVVVGTWELVRAIRATGARPPLIPLAAGGVVMITLAWWGQVEGLAFGLFLTVFAVMIWRLADGPTEYGPDVVASALVAVYVPFLGGFAALLATPEDGGRRVITMVALVVLSDTGGYVSGVLFGRHPMAPSVSPKKSWEGLAGSLVASGVGGAILLGLLFHVWFGWGALFGLAVAAAATVGDLGESLFKRDLGIKDMSRLLPGHGGLMDRLDSVLFAAPTAFVLFSVLAPPS